MDADRTRGGLGGRFEALGDKVKHRCDLLTRHVELLHHFFSSDAQILEILDDGCDWQSRVAKPHASLTLPETHSNNGVFQRTKSKRPTFLRASCAFPIER